MWVSLQQFARYTRAYIPACQNSKASCFVAMRSAIFPMKAQLTSAPVPEMQLIERQQSTVCEQTSRLECNPPVMQRFESRGLALMRGEGRRIY